MLQPTYIRKHAFIRLIILLAFSASTFGCFSETDNPKHLPTAERAKGFLEHHQLPNSLTLIPPPPKEGSISEEEDIVISQQQLALRDSDRWQLATSDAAGDLMTAAARFSCAMQQTISPSETPKLYTLLERSLTDITLSLIPTRRFYQRPAPFTVNQQPICTPQYRDKLLKRGAYPSGHSALGWAWALLLSEIAPDRSEALLKRGREFGQSRVACNVNWQSDVDEGRVVASAVVAKLHTSAAFNQAIEEAKKEYRQLLETGSKSEPCHQ